MSTINFHLDTVLNLIQSTHANHLTLNLSFILKLINNCFMSYKYYCSFLRTCIMGPIRTTYRCLPLDTLNQNTHVITIICFNKNNILDIRLSSLISLFHCSTIFCRIATPSVGYLIKPLPHIFMLKDKKFSHPAML